MLGIYVSKMHQLDLRVSVCNVYVCVYHVSLIVRSLLKFVLKYILSIYVGIYIYIFTI